MTNQLLDFRKIESDHFLVNPTSFNVTELLRNACANFQSAAEQRNLQMQFIAAETIFVQADEESTIKIISNLLDTQPNGRRVHGTITPGYSKKYYGS